MCKTSVSDNNFSRIKKYVTALLLISMLLSCTSVVSFAAEETYTIQSGDTLGKIANSYGVSVDDIVKYNNITNPNNINANQVLKIPEKGYSDSSDIIVPSKSENNSVSKPEIIPDNLTVTEAGDTQTIEGLDYNTMVNNMDTVTSINVVNTDVRDVLSAFAVKLGMNVIFKGAPSNITLKLSDVTIGSALDYVMKIIGMNYVLDEKTIIVGSKDVLMTDFSDSLQFTEFNLKYTTAEVIKSQIQTLGIEVTLVETGDNQTRFIAKGFAGDLAKVRNLVTMIDKKSNVMAGSTNIQTSFYAISLVNVTADGFSAVLASLNLPQGVVIADKPYTLYVYASPDEYKSIISLKATVDTASKDVIPTAGQSVIKQVNFKYVTLDLIEDQIKSFSGVTVIKVATNKSTAWLQGTADQFAKADEIIKILDIEANANITEEAMNSMFRYIKLTNISAVQFNSTLSKLGLSLPGIIYEDNPKTLYVFASDDQYLSMLDIQKVVDTPENASKADREDIYRKVTLVNINKEFAIPFIDSLGLDVEVINIGNLQKAIWLKGPEEEVMQAVSMVSSVDTNDSSLNCTFKTYTLSYLTAAEMVEKINLLGLSGVSTYPFQLSTFSRNILVIFPSDMESTVNSAIAALDVPTDPVTLMIETIKITFEQKVEKIQQFDPVTGAPIKDAAGNNVYKEEKVPLTEEAVSLGLLEAKNKLFLNRIPLIARMAGIDITKFRISENTDIDTTTTGNATLVIYIENGTLAEIQKARDIVADLAIG